LAAVSLVLPFAVAAQSGKAAPNSTDGRELIAVLNLKEVNASEAQASALSDRLREVLLKSGRFTLVDRSQIESILNEQALQQAGCTDQECAVQVGRLLGVRKIVAGRVTRVQEGLWLISAIMVDVETAETVRAESVRHSGDFPALLDASIEHLGRKLAASGGAQTAALRGTSAPTAIADEMARVPAGEFITGRDGGFFDPDNEKPAHTVRLDAFRIDRTEVTQEAYERVMGSNPSAYKFPGNPVESVTWAQADEYCRKAGKRLPTEAEWERAARAGSLSLYWWGDDNSDAALLKRANYLQPVNQREQDGYAFTAPVGRFEPNPLGLLDLYGNVAEWVSDWVGDYSATWQENPSGPAQGSRKVVRGGSWRDKPKFLGSTVRDSAPPAEARDYIGFRCAASGE
jgi:formylglycine-generating enzyme required for sulfatase activity